MTRFIHLALLSTAIGFASLNIVACDSDSKSEKDDKDDEDDEVTVKAVCKAADKKAEKEEWDDWDGQEECEEKVEGSLDRIKEMCGKKVAEKALKVFDSCIDKNDDGDDVEDCIDDKLGSLMEDECEEPEEDEPAKEKTGKTKGPAPAMKAPAPAMKAPAPAMKAPAPAPAMPAPVAAPTAATSKY